MNEGHWIEDEKPHSSANTDYYLNIVCFDMQAHEHQAHFSFLMLPYFVWVVPSARLKVCLKYCGPNHHIVLPSLAPSLVSLWQQGLIEIHPHCFLYMHSNSPPSHHSYKVAQLRQRLHKDPIQGQFIKEFCPILSWMIKGGEENLIYFLQKAYFPCQSDKLYARSSAAFRPYYIYLELFFKKLGDRGLHSLCVTVFLKTTRMWEKHGSNVHWRISLKPVNKE